MKSILKRDYWIAIVCRAGIILTELMITIFLNRGLGVAAKGEYSYIIRMVEMLYVFGGLGIGQAYTMFKKEGNTQIRGTIVTLSFIQALATGGFVFIIGKIVDLTYTKEIALLSTLAVIKWIIAMIAVIENSIKKNLMQVSINIVYTTILAILFFRREIELKNVIGIYVLIDTIKIILMLGLYKMKPAVKSFKLNSLKKLYKVGILTMIFSLLTTVNYSFSTIMLKELSTSYAVGIYSVGSNFTTLFLLIPDAFKEVLFGDSTEKNFSAKTVKNAIGVSTGIAMIAMLGWLIFGKLAIKILYGTEYMESYAVTSVLFVGCFSLIFFKILQPIYISNGKQKIAIVFLLVSAILNMIMNWFLIPRHGFMGAAVTTAASYSVCGIAFLIYYVRQQKKQLKAHLKNIE